MRKDIVLEQGGTLEEELALTVVPRDIFRKHRDRFNIFIVSKHPEVWSGNRYVSQVLEHHQDAIKLPKVSEYSSGDKHMLQVQLLIAQEALKDYHIDKLILTEFRPHFRLKPADAALRPGLEQITRGCPYWVIHNGWSMDNSIKSWDNRKFNNLVRNISSNNPLKFLQLSVDITERNSKIEHALPLCNELPIRTVMWLIQHAHGVITTSGFFSHAAAAMGKPCIVIAGSSISKALNAYDSDNIERWAADTPDKYADLTKSLMPQLYHTGKGCSEKPCGNMTLNKDQPCAKVVEPKMYDEKSPSMPQATCMYSIELKDILKEVNEYEEAMASIGYDAVDAAIDNVLSTLKGDNE